MCLGEVRVERGAQPALRNEDDIVLVFEKRLPKLAFVPNLRACAP